MRKIEQQMLQAIHARKGWALDNTRIQYCPPVQTDKPLGACSYIYLHNNLIATYWHDAIDNPLKVDLLTLKRYPTNTTKSRLRALGVNVATRKGVTYLDNVAI